ncbi:MAG: ABC transporter ATP-binding protein [Candidatus Devosia phytovorans]|uniref:ABC transporter ATP-binding protein n=1 Tax=Candidatus Devosia phytovorans TaxID=3121372 RepID=A0AAJ5VS82_9HYPH|nr:ABC transporter ATP-binding protein [Devosia sp.]WEK03779.1 MAG: ABC transporter ATP-binding protein [Devosia sp.]
MLLHYVLGLWKHLSRRRRVQFYALIVLMILASVAEVASIGLIVPFLGALTAPDQILSNSTLRAVADRWSITTSSDLVLLMGVAFCGAALVAGAIRLLLLYATTKFSFALGADLSLEVYRRTLYQPYSVHLERNSSEVINGIIVKTATIISSVLVPLLTIITSAVLLVGILAALLAIDPIIAVSSIMVVGLLYWIVLRITRESMRRDSEIIARESSKVVQALQEGLGGIRDVLLDSTQELCSRIYQASDRPLRLAQGRQIIATGSPRFLIEAFGMVVIAILAVWITQRSNGGEAAVPLLGALALGAQRLLPIVQQGYSSLSTIRGAEASLRDMMALLGQTIDTGATVPAARLPFNRTMVLREIDFTYGRGGPQVLRKLNLTIPRGSRIGIFGQTGGGKSTLLDIMMGLLRPTSGQLVVDDTPIDQTNQRGWQLHIAHVPQSIYLSDNSITENIAFGVSRDKIDIKRVLDAARRAQMHDVITSWPEQYDTFVGERGVRLSGGQRQRIGVARALYKQADVIILDEATSALDDETERNLMDSIEGLGEDITLIIVAHRLSTLRNCHFVAEVMAGGIKEFGSYEDIIAPRLQLQSLP